MNVRNRIESYLSGVNEKEIQAIEQVTKTILQETLKKACRTVYDSLGDGHKEYVLAVYNEMLEEVKNG